MSEPNVEKVETYSDVPTPSESESHHVGQWNVQHWLMKDGESEWTNVSGPAYIRFLPHKDRLYYVLRAHRTLKTLCTAFVPLSYVLSDTGDPELEGLAGNNRYCVVVSDTKEAWSFGREIDCQGFMELWKKKEKDGPVSASDKSSSLEEPYGTSEIVISVTTFNQPRPIS